MGRRLGRTTMVKAHSHGGCPLSPGLDPQTADRRPQTTAAAAAGPPPVCRCALFRFFISLISFRSLQLVEPPPGLAPGSGSSAHAYGFARSRPLARGRTGRFRRSHGPARCCQTARTLQPHFTRSASQPLGRERVAVDVGHTAIFSLICILRLFSLNLKASADRDVVMISAIELSNCGQRACAWDRSVSSIESLASR